VRLDHLKSGLVIALEGTAFNFMLGILMFAFSIGGNFELQVVSE